MTAHRQNRLNLALWGCVLVLVVTVAVLSYLQRSHIAWYFHPLRKNAHRMPVDRLPSMRPPGDWSRCTLGALEFDLPASLHADQPPTIDTRLSGLLTFESKTLRLSVFLPRDATSFIRSHNAALPPGLRESSDSLTALQVRAYQADGSDFGWSMSRAELQSHASLVSYKTFACSRSARTVEHRSDEELEGLLLVLNAKSAVFEWRAKDDGIFGTLIFESPPGKLDLPTVRAICTSLACNGTTYPKELSKQQLTSIRDAMQIEPVPPK